MWKPTPYIFLPDAPFDLGDDDIFGVCPAGGLCSPDDPLEEIIHYVRGCKGNSTDVLGLYPLSSLDSSELSPGFHGEDDDNCYKRVGDVDMDTLTMDICATGEERGSLAGDADPFVVELCAAAGGRRKRNACGMFKLVAEHAPTLQEGGLRTCTSIDDGFVDEMEHELSSSTNSSSSWMNSTSSSSRGLASASGVLRLTWSVLKWRRRSSTARKRPWPLALTIMPAATNTSHDDDNDDVYDKCSKLSGNGKGRGRSGVRHRNRRRQRTCDHCGSSETPQWRAGPKGPGSLCNACGIRYKLGKLYPEYRPFENSTRHGNVGRVNF